MSQIDQDIDNAKAWSASPSMLVGLPGEGTGWRATCYRLAVEVERLRKVSLDLTETVKVMNSGTIRGEIEFLQEVVHQTATSKGWWDEPRGIPECLALIHSEVSEALEDYRNKQMDLMVWRPDRMEYRHDILLEKAMEGWKPEGFPSELADIVIRVLDLAEHLGINLAEAIHVKHTYNKTRPYRHGGKIA